MSAQQSIRRRQALFGRRCASRILLIWLLRSMLLPFLLGMALAYVATRWRSVGGAPGSALAGDADRPRRHRRRRYPGAGSGCAADRQSDHAAGLPGAALHRCFATPGAAASHQLCRRVGGPHDAADLQKEASAYVGNLSSWIVGILGRSGAAASSSPTLSMCCC